MSHRPACGAGVSRPEPPGRELRIRRLGVRVPPSAPHLTCEEVFLSWSEDVFAQRAST
jgi:hypothetical protein